MNAQELIAPSGITSAASEPGLLRTFLHYLIPSIVALLSVSTAAVVDGLLVAHYLGPEAVSAVNLLIPPMTLMFGLSLMFAIGGGVQCAYYKAENDNPAANAIFSNTIFLVLILAIFLAASTFLLRYPLFTLLGASPEIIALLDAYFCVLLLGVPLQLVAVVFYYFVRGLGHPRKATAALLCGAGINAALDIYLLGVLRLGIASAAWATVAAQLTQFLILLTVMLRYRILHWQLDLRRIKETIRSSANGLSEFVNEISVGLVIGVTQWILIRQHGVDAVAGFALVNYGLFINAMVCCAVAEVIYTLGSQNIGAGRVHRAHEYLRLAILCTLAFTIGFTLILIAFGPQWFAFLVPSAAAEYAIVFLNWLWPVFTLCGLNMAISAWFTGCRRVKESTVIAMSRSLILPAMFIVLIYWTGLNVPAVAALPTAEIITFALAVWFFLRNGMLRKTESF